MHLGACINRAPSGVEMLGVWCAGAWAQGLGPSDAFTFGGQFRINTFAERSLEDVPVTLLGERIRLRPSARFRLDDGVAGFLQLEANQVDNAFVFRARYADASVAFGDLELHAGLLPLSDQFGDTLFSASWDFNPLAAELRGKAERWSGRVAAGLVYQGPIPTQALDDVALVLGDLDRGTFGVSVVAVGGAQESAVLQSNWLLVPGVRFTPKVGDGTLAFALLGSALLPDGPLDPTSFGGAGRVEATIPVGSATVSALGLYATGGGLSENSDDGPDHAFVTPMSAFGFHGYWGYTGRLTVQGPTDQGMDDPYNIDGGTYDRTRLGQGMATLQGRLAAPVSKVVTLTGAAGAFAGAEGGLYGVDGLGGLTWKPRPEVALDSIGTVTRFGAEHHARADTTSLALATRLQLEF
jgi:hypothetical protein